MWCTHYERCFVVLELNNNDGNLEGESLLDRPCHPQKRITPSVALRCRLLIVVLAGPLFVIITYANNDSKDNDGDDNVV